ncbi:DUF4133 domain-containing protein [Flavitalea flava]
MANTIYPINRGIGIPLQFKGFIGQYIYYAAGIFVGSFILLAILYMIGVSSYICLPLTFLLAGGGITKILKLSQKYGPYGQVKRKAARKIPRHIRSSTRKTFIHLKK